MRVVNPNFQIDPHLNDEKGYTLDGGVRGVLNNVLYYDVSGFLLMYNKRIGTILKVDSITYQIVRYRTNVSDSRNMGVEVFAELDWIKLINRNAKHKLSTFINTSFINATYINSEQKAFEGKRVEYVPELIMRTGINYGFKDFKFTCQYSYTDFQYTDATNSEYTPSAIYGIVPAYSVVDLSLSYTYKKFTLSGGVNNLTDAIYFTRRAEGYPGPGIIPADPRNIYTTLQFKF
ncbi:MAG: TonB-dependent receptor [Bacteroidia bacterium]|nr:TonB-dependent receptor [Bacteroidia bacterium]